MKFFRNLILGEKNELKNRHLHIEGMGQSATEEGFKVQFLHFGGDCTDRLYQRKTKSYSERDGDSYR